MADCSVVSAGRETQELPRTARATAAEVLSAFRAKDGERLASFVHPDKGVRFSPSAFVNVEDDVVLSRYQVARFWADANSYPFGYDEESGRRIPMTSRVFAERYILNMDYSKVTTAKTYSKATIDKAYNDYQRGTTGNNAVEVYPDAIIVEYHIKPSNIGPEGAFDWSALRIVLENVANSWFIVAVIHDGWSQ